MSRRAALGVLRAAVLLTGAGMLQAATAREAGRLRVGGTGMALATMRQIADAFGAGAPGADIDVLPSLGTGGGLAAVAAGAIDLALSARVVTEAESAKGLRGAPYASTPIAFVTHPSNGLRAVTFAHITQILDGTLTVWPDGTPIRLVRREPSDADWAMLRGVSPEMARAVAIALQRPGLLTVATDQQNAETLERLRGSFGAISIGQLRAESRRLAPLALNGVMPDSEAVASGRYPLQRTLHAVWRDPPDADLLAFLVFLRGSEAAAILAGFGHAPLLPGPAP